jgi:4'-phosphopantetheinyl transferase
VTPAVPAWTPGAVHVWWHATPAGEDAPRARRGRLDRLLRAVLARYVQREPASLRFARESKGRPYLADGGPDFNLSDTTGGTVVAVAQGGRLGVDLERLDRVMPHQRLAKRYFAPREIAALGAMPEDAARRAFLYLWTAKESSCKSTGTGIYGQLPRWEFDAGEAGDPRLVAWPAEASPRERWHHARVEPAPGYTCVLACDGYVPQPVLLVLD